MQSQQNLKRGLCRTASLGVFLLWPFCAHAFDLSPNVSRVVSDPAYLPKGGQLFGSTEYSDGITNSNANNAAGVQTSTTNTISNAVSQVFEFGITDDFTLRAADAYQWPTSDTTAADGLITETGSNGFVDPTFGIIWRVLDEQDHFFNWDLVGSYAPNFLNAQSADPTQDGTVARGGDTAVFGTALSYKGEDFTLYLEGTASYLADRSILNPSNNITTDYDASWQYNFSLLTQTRFSKKWSINLGLTQVDIDSANGSFVNNSGNTISVNSRPGDVTNFTAALNLQFAPNRFVMSVIYNYDFYGNGAFTNFNQPNSSNTTTNKGESVYSLEFRYVF
jgi:hypothetical protein